MHLKGCGDIFVVGTACFTSICFDLVWTALVGYLRQCVAVLKLGLCMLVIGRPGLWSSLGLVVRELGPGMLWPCGSSYIQVPECCLLLQFVKVLVLCSPIHVSGLMCEAAMMRVMWPIL